MNNETRFYGSDDSPVYREGQIYKARSEGERLCDMSRDRLEEVCAEVGVDIAHGAPKHEMINRLAEKA